MFKILSNKSINALFLQYSFIVNHKKKPFADVNKLIEVVTSGTAKSFNVLDYIPKNHTVEIK